MAAEAFALRKRPAAWILLAAWLMMTVCFAYLFPYLASRSTTEGGAFQDDLSSAQLLDSVLPGRLISAVTGGMPVFGGALALVLGALVVGSPYGWGTLKTALTQRSGRVPLLLGTALLLALVLLGVVLVTFGVGALASTVVATAESRPLDWPPLSEVARGVGAAWLIVTMWCSVGVLLATVSRSTSLSIGLGLVWAFVVEGLVRGLSSSLEWLEAFSRVLPGGNAGSLAAALLPDGVPVDTPGVDAVVGGGTATLVLLGYVAVATALSAALLHRRDLS
jgi:ABC-type transport system involved in multi-copper enzyme maturation permease subunit